MSQKILLRTKDVSASEALEYLGEVVITVMFVIGLGFSLYPMPSRPHRIPNFIERGLQE